MAYIPWYDRLKPATLGERFGLNEISTARNTLSPTNSHTINRIDMKPGGLVEAGVTHYGKGHRAPLTQTEKEIVASWQKRIGDKINVAYKDLPHKLQFQVRQGMNVLNQKLNPVKSPGATTYTDVVNKEEFKEFYKKNYFNNPDSTLYKKEFKGITTDLKAKAATRFKAGRLDIERLTFFPERGKGKEILNLYNKQLNLYGEPNLSAIARKLFPNRAKLDGIGQVRRFLKKHTSYDRKVDPKKTGDTAAKRREKKLYHGEKKISDKALEAELSASKKSGMQLQHADALKKRNVTLNNLTYLPKSINAYLSTTEGFLRRKEKEIVDLLKTKPKNYKQKISSLNAQAMNKMFHANQKLVEAGFPMFKDSLDFYTFDETGKPMQLGGTSGQRFGTIIGKQIGLDPNKPIKNFSSEEIVKARNAKNVLIDQTKKMYDDAIKKGADASSFEKIKFVKKDVKKAIKNKLHSAGLGPVVWGSVFDDVLKQMAEGTSLGEALASQVFLGTAQKGWQEREYTKKHLTPEHVKLQNRRRLIKMAAETRITPFDLTMAAERDKEYTGAPHKYLEWLQNKIKEPASQILWEERKNALETGMKMSDEELQKAKQRYSDWRSVPAVDALTRFFSSEEDKEKYRKWRLEHITNV